MKEDMIGENKISFTSDQILYMSNSYKKEIKKAMTDEQTKITRLAISIRDKYDTVKDEWGAPCYSSNNAVNMIVDGYKEGQKDNEDQINELKRWKAEAIEVMPDFQELAKLMELQIGQRVSSKLTPYIKRLKEVNENALQKIVELQKQLKGSPKWVAPNIHPKKDGKYTVKFVDDDSCGTIYFRYDSWYWDKSDVDSLIAVLDFKWLDEGGVK